MPVDTDKLQPEDTSSRSFLEHLCWGCSSAHLGVLGKNQMWQSLCPANMRMLAQERIEESEQKIPEELRKMHATELFDFLATELIDFADRIDM